MTVFWREGFYRTSSGGDIHFVSGHWVHREDWDRQSSGHSDAIAYYEEQLRAARVHRIPTARFVNPNAECPVCGQAVYFFQNEHGSRVYFDDLGPPWPKHPCTSSFAAANASGEGKFDVVSPKGRSDTEISAICRWLKILDVDLEAEFSRRYGLGQWKPWTIQGRFRGKGNVLLVLGDFENSDSTHIYFKAKKLDKCFHEGALVFQFRNWIACFDVQNMVPVEIKLQRLRGSKAFVDELVAIRNPKS